MNGAYMATLALGAGTVQAAESGATAENKAGSAETAATGSGVKVHKRFVRVNGRGVHYLRAGKGPAAVLLHAGMASAEFERAVVEKLAATHTTFAFDLPGFGDSDPMGLDHVRAADVADWLVAALDELNVQQFVIFGSHTGSHIALEVGRRHRSRVVGMVLEGVGKFNASEQAFFLSDLYLAPFVVHDDGSHLLTTWTQAHDDSLWMPWSVRTAETRMTFPRPDPDMLHFFVVTRMRSGDGYRATYTTVFELDGYAAVASQDTPMTIMAFAWDPMYKDLDGVPPLKPGQRIARFPAEADYEETKAKLVREFKQTGDVPPNPPFRPTPGVVNRRYVDLAHGQVLLRSAGEGRKGKPLLLLHDGRGSSRVVEPLMRALMKDRPIYALDLPDNGASDPFPHDQPTIADYASAAAETVKAAGIGPCDVYGIGAGSAVALELVNKPEFQKARIVLDSPDFYAPTFARELSEKWVPPLKPDMFAGYLNQVWFMLRAEYAFWPWYNGSIEAAFVTDAPSDWTEVNARVTDILRSLGTYQRLTQAALRYDWATALHRAGTQRVRLVTSANDPRQKHAKMAAQTCGFPDPAVLPAVLDAKAGIIVEMVQA